MVNCVLWLAARRLLVRSWAWKEHMFPGQTPASSLRESPSYLGLGETAWDSENFSHCKMESSSGFEEKPQETTSLWNPRMVSCSVLYRSFPCLHDLIGAHVPLSFMNMAPLALAETLLSLKQMLIWKEISTVHEDWEERCHHIPYWTPAIPSLQVSPLPFHPPPSTTKQMSSSKISQAHTDHGGHPHSAVIYTQIFFRFS